MRKSLHCLLALFIVLLPFAAGVSSADASGAGNVEISAAASVKSETAETVLKKEALKTTEVKLEDTKADKKEEAKAGEKPAEKKEKAEAEKKPAEKKEIKNDKLKGGMELSASAINFRNGSETYPRQYRDLDKKALLKSFDLRSLYSDKLYFKLEGTDIGSEDNYGSNAKFDWRGRFFLSLYKDAIAYNGVSSSTGLTNNYSTVRKLDGIGVGAYAGPNALLRYNYARTQLAGSNRFGGSINLRTENYLFSAETVRLKIPFRATFGRSDFSPSSGGGDFYRESFKYEAVSNETNRPYFYAKSYSAETVNKFDGSRRYTEDGGALSAAAKLNGAWKMTLSGYNNGFDNSSSGSGLVMFPASPAVARYNFNNGYKNNGLGANFYYSGIKKAYLSFGISQDRTDRNFFGSGLSAVPSNQSTNYRLKYTVKPTKNITYTLLARYTGRTGGTPVNIQDASRPIYPFYAMAGKRMNVAVSANQIINKNLSAGLTLSQNKVANDQTANGGVCDNTLKQMMFNALWTPASRLSVNYSASVSDSDLSLLSKYYLTGRLNSVSNSLSGRDLVHTFGGTYFARRDTDINLDFTNSISTSDGIVNALKIGEFTTNIEWLRRLKNGDEVSVRGTNIKFYDRYFPVNEADTNVLTLNYKLKF